jgi:hypothetical protein
MKLKLLFLSIVSVLSLVFFSLTTANAADFGLLGGLTFSKPSVKVAGATDTTTSINGSTYGAYLVFGLTRGLDFEVEGLYQTSKFTTAAIQSNPSYTTQLQSVTVPVLFRIDLTRYFNIGVGGYYSEGVGNVQTNTGGIVTPSSYADDGLAKTDYGAVGSVQILLPISYRTALVLEGKYFYGIKNLDLTSSDEFKTRTLNAMAGLNFIL